MASTGGVDSFAFGRLSDLGTAQGLSATTPRRTQEIAQNISKALSNDLMNAFHVRVAVAAGLVEVA